MLHAGYNPYHGLGLLGLGGILPTLTVDLGAILAARRADRAPEIVPPRAASGDTLLARARLKAVQAKGASAADIDYLTCMARGAQ